MFDARPAFLVILGVICTVGINAELCAETTEQAVLEFLNDRCRDSQDLRGACPAKVELKDGVFHVDLVMDPDNEKATADAIGQLLEKQFPDDKFEVKKSQDFAFRKLLAAAQKKLGEDPEYGIRYWVDGAYLETKEGEFNVTPFGGCIYEAQRTVIGNTIKQLIPKDSGMVVATDRIINDARIEEKEIIEENETRKLRSALRSEIHSSKDLQGFWLDIVAAHDPLGKKVDHYRVYLWVDAPPVKEQVDAAQTSTEVVGNAESISRTSELDRAEKQRGELIKMLEKHLGKDKFRIVHEDRLPLSQVLKEIQKAAEEKWGIGCFFAGLYYRSPSLENETAAKNEEGAVPTADGNSDTIEAVLYGRLPVGVNELEQNFKDWISDKIKGNPLWKNAITPRGQSLVVVFDDVKVSTNSAPTANVQKAIRTEIARDPQLHGAWLRIAECHDHLGILDHYDVYLGLDGGEVEGNTESNSRTSKLDRAQKQRNELTKLLEKQLGLGKFRIVHEERLPLSQVLKEIQTAAEEKWGKGCFFAGLYYRSPPGEDEAAAKNEEGEAPAANRNSEQIEAVLYGRLPVGINGLEQNFKDWISGKIKEHPLWKKAITPRGQSLIVDFDNVTVSTNSTPTASVEKSIREEITRDTQLHGAWLQIAECPDHLGNLDHYDVYLWQDNSPVHEAHLPAPHIIEVENHFSYMEEVPLLPDLTLECPTLACPPVQWPDVLQTQPFVIPTTRRLAKGTDITMVPDPLYEFPPKPTQPISAAEQRKRIVAMLDRILLDAPYEVVFEAELPLRALSEELQNRLNARYGRKCYFPGAYYSTLPESQESEVSFYGQVDNEQQLKEATEWAQTEFERAAWRTLSVPRQARLIINAEHINVRSNKLLEQERDALVDVHKAIYDFQDLQGTRVDLDACLNHEGKAFSYDVAIWTAGEMKLESRQKLAKILRETLGTDFRVVAVSDLPLAQLLTRVNLSITADRVLDHCFLAGGYYTFDATLNPPSHVLHVQGRLGNEQQLEQVRRLVTARMASSPFWRKSVTQLNTDSIVSVESSGLRGAHLFADGVTNYWDGDFAAAERAFQQAIVESPDSVSYRYWQILAEMKLEKRELAYQRMLAVTSRNPTPSEKYGVNRSLTRVQGGDRVELLQMESRAKMEFHVVLQKRRTDQNTR